MRKTGLMLLVVGMVLGWSLVQAGEVDRETFYKQVIEQKIAQCKRNADLVHSRGENLQSYGREAEEQLAFYRTKQDELVQEMMTHHVGTNVHQVEYFLIKAYIDARDSRLATR